MRERERGKKLIRKRIRRDIDWLLLLLMLLMLFGTPVGTVVLARSTHLNYESMSIAGKKNRERNGKEGENWPTSGTLALGCHHRRR